MGPGKGGYDGFKLFGGDGGEGLWCVFDWDFSGEEKGGEWGD